ncbi:hypothetical protein FRB98_004676 [Tulasnella sp. 332]|nr:hypothetical protein FRB98_004676 [Tulasnella sp. 332]
MSSTNTSAPVNIHDPEDPLSLLIQPPTNETASERQRRLEEEAKAKQRSDEIDNQLKQELKKKKAQDKREIKVLLLGQSESGKSTCIKQFQLLYSPVSFAQERESWKSVVYLNLVKSVRKVLDAITETSPSEDPSSGDDDLDDFGAPTLRKKNSRGAHGAPIESMAQRAGTPIAFGQRAGSTATTSNNIGDSPSPPERDSEDAEYGQFATIKLRLSPLALAEDLLIHMLAGPEGDEESQWLGAWATADPSSAAMNNSSKHSFGNGRIKEVFVRSGSNWKGLFSNRDVKDGAQRQRSLEGRKQLQHDPFLLVSACKDDMIMLWKDQNVQKILRQKGIRLEEMPGFYLNDLARVAAPEYVPSTQDVLTARLKTLGVVEHFFKLQSGGSPDGGDWRIYDVGGHRDQRHTWAPFFDSVQAIIFLAPISAFDQVLLEDKRVNRIEDSLLLFRSVCANKLLGKNIVLFLNKIDILKAKLKSGIQLRKYIRSYGEKPNTFEHVSRYLLSKFVAVHKDNSPIAGRELFTHMTAVTDIETTKVLIGEVSKDTKRDTKGSNDTFPASFLQRIKSRFSISAGVVEAPPPYARDTASPSLVTTSLARIKAVNEYGQILGYVAHNFTDGGYNLQPLDKAVEVDLPVQGKRARAKDALLQIGFQKLMKVLQTPLSLSFRGLLDPDLVALDLTEKTGAIYKNRSNIRRADDLIGVGKPASSRVWSLHTIEDGYEELRLNWRDKTGGEYLDNLGSIGTVLTPLDASFRHDRSEGNIEQGAVESKERLPVMATQKRLCAVRRRTSNKTDR